LTARRNHVPWAIIGACYVVGPLLLLLIRALLARENRARAAAGPDAAEEDVYITVADADGKLVERRVDKVRPLTSCSCTVQRGR
jgi:ACS family allantoate permease-like MFS transporter